MTEFHIVNFPGIQSFNHNCVCVYVCVCVIYKGHSVNMRNLLKKKQFFSIDVNATLFGIGLEQKLFYCCKSI